MLCVGVILLATVVTALGVGCSGEEGPEQVQMTPQQRGERGESCRARNDCKEGLACVRNTCVRNDYAIEGSSGECVLIQCETTDDCCELDAQCQTYEDECASGDQNACDQFDYYCQCNQECVDNQCQTVESCSTDSDCYYGTCDNGVCVECTSNDECYGDELCIDGRCDEGCKADANCPLFHSCQDGECVEQGCESDRECVLFTEDGDAVCNEGKCIVPCSNDAECNSGGDSFFEVCEAGRCVFVGCQTDHECRIALDIANTSGDFRAVCETGGQ